MLPEDSCPDELDAMLVQQPPRLFRVCKPHTSGGNPQPTLYASPIPKVERELPPSSYTLCDHNADFIVSTRVRLDGNDVASWRVT